MDFSLNEAHFIALLLIGAVFIGIGQLILFFGLADGVTRHDYINQAKGSSRKNPEKYFNDTYLIYAKIFKAIGATFCFISACLIFLILYRLYFA
ncbi:MAG: hypothetical protein GKR92_02480 [Gammaproteobacteria bacterium]|nr:MAG: hypothetical protein GKR92_02480 [Gammaproteobacteria bacterium]